MRTMKKSAAALIFAALMPPYAAQDSALLQRTDTPEQGVWVD
jgi:hypothetical protein